MTPRRQASIERHAREGWTPGGWKRRAHWRDGAGKTACGRRTDVLPADRTPHESTQCEICGLAAADGRLRKEIQQ